MAKTAESHQLRKRAEAARTMNCSQQDKQSLDEAKKEPVQMNRSGGKMAVCCFLGIFISYFVYGLLQEKM